MTLELVVLEGVDVAERVPVRAGLVIGRRSDCDLSLPNDTVSGRHARIVEGEAGQLVVEDMGSQNKTVVEGGPTLTKGASHPLSPGLTLVLGKVKLRCEGADADELATMADPGATLADPGATMADPGATVRDPGGAAQGSGGAAPKSGASESSVIPAWRMETPAPGGVQRPDPAPAAQAPDGGDAGEFVTMGLSPDLQGDAFQDLASKAALEAFRPRVVVDNDLARQIVDIRTPEFTIGREGCNMNIAHGAVSARHARIVFDPTSKRLRIVDAGSKNFTFLGGELVPPDVPRELAPHAHLRIGPIDLLFVIDTDYDGEPVPPDVLATAVEMLEAEGAITHEQRAKAEQAAKADQRHVGEMLILAGAIDAKRWVRALDHARLALVSRSLPSPELQRLKLAVIALTVAVVALFVLVFVV